MNDFLIATRFHCTPTFFSIPLWLDYHIFSWFFLLLEFTSTVSNTYFLELSPSLRKICDTTGFCWPVFIRKRTEVMILSLYTKVRFSGNPYSCIFYTVHIDGVSFSSLIMPSRIFIIWALKFERNLFESFDIWMFIFTWLFVFKKLFLCTSWQ